jgi:DNA-binding transcriptional ArsR family regulator
MPTPTRSRRARAHLDESEQVALVLNALVHPTRRWLLMELDTRVGIPIHYLMEEMSITRQGLHKHLQILVRAGIVIKSGLGPYRLYYIDPRPIRKVFAELARCYKRDLWPLGNLYRYGSPNTPWD